VLGLLPVGLTTGTDMHGGDQRVAAVRRRGGELVAIEAGLAALAAVAHLGVDCGADPVRASPAMKPRNTVLIGVEVLADQLAQQVVRGLDLLVLEQSVRPLDGLQRPLSVLRDPGEHPLALGLLPPATLRLLAWPLVLKLKPSIQLLAGPWVDRRDRVDQLLDSVTDQPDSVLGGGCPEHRGGIDDLLSRPVQHPQLLREPQRVIKRQPLLLVQQQPGTEPGQRRRMPPLMIDRQPERNLPPQIPRHALHRLLITNTSPVLQQHHLRQKRRRDRRPTHPLRITLREVPITHDPITMLRQQREERPLGKRPRQHRRIKHPYQERLSSKHA
jgi:hypothetical protein